MGMRMMAAAAAVGLLLAGCGTAAQEQEDDTGYDGPSLATLAFWDELDESGTLDAACDLGSPAVMVASLVGNDITDEETAGEYAEYGRVMCGW